MKTPSLQAVGTEGTRTPVWSLLYAESVVWLPGRAPVRRELLNPGSGPGSWILRPDGSEAGVSIQFDGAGLLSILAGPERASLDLDFILHADRHPLPLWAIARGGGVEVTLSDHFGRLVIPDLLARGVDSAPACLEAGRYLLQAIVEGNASMRLGLGANPALAQDLRGRRAAG